MYLLNVGVKGFVPLTRDNEKILRIAVKSQSTRACDVCQNIDHSKQATHQTVTKPRHWQKRVAKRCPILILFAIIAVKRMREAAHILVLNEIWMFRYSLM